MEAPSDPPGERIGRRARVCVRVCLGFRAAKVLGRGCDRPVAVPAPLPVRPAAFGVGPRGLERQVQTEG